MEIASLVLGIISIIITFIPFVWSFSIIIFIIGLTLGIIALAKKKERVKSIIGIILCIISIVLVVIALQDISNTFNNTETTTSTNIETGKQETTNNEQLKENVIIEPVRIN